MDIFRRLHHLIGDLFLFVGEALTTVRVRVTQVWRVSYNIVDIFRRLHHLIGDLFLFVGLLFFKLDFLVE